MSPVRLLVAIAIIMVASAWVTYLFILPPPSETIETFSVGRAPLAPDGNPLATMWTEDYDATRCLMHMINPHGETQPQSVLVLTVGFGRPGGEPLGFAFNFPKNSDQDRGAAIAFAHTGTDDEGKFAMELAEEGFRVYPFDTCEGEGCVIFIPGAIAPAHGEYGDLDLLEQFLTRDMMFFYYWVDGELVRSSATLSGFQAQYPEVMENLRMPTLAGIQ